MKQSFKKVSSAIATGILMSSLFAPAAFADTISITNNGAFSNNTVNVSGGGNGGVTINQTNNMTVNTSINSTASTGGNSSNFNNGGSSTITTGNATNDTNVTVNGGSNTASLPLCGCENSPLEVTVADNAAFSNNTVNIKGKKAGTKVTQTNKLVVNTKLNNKAKTGKNDSSFNNGGDSTITSGEASNTTDVLVTAPSNTL